MMTDPISKRSRARLSQADIRRHLEDADAALMEAVVAGCAVVAYADGWVKEEEQRRMRGLIRRFEPVAAFGMADILQAFDDVSAGFALDHDAGETFALSQVARLSSRPRDADLLIETCCSIAKADGGFDSEEREAILKMCALLGVDPARHL